MFSLKGNNINERVIQKLAKEGYNSNDLKQFRLRLLDRPFDSKQQLEEEILSVFGKDFNRNLVLRGVKLSQRLSVYRIYWFVNDFFFPQSLFVLKFLNWLSISPLILFIRMRLRFLFFKLKWKLRNYKFNLESHENKKGYDHNHKQIMDFSLGHRKRTERLIMAMKCIEDFPQQSPRMLVVGPRNEGELMLLQAHGYKNFLAIDLFSYSSMIKVMDMNNIRVDNDTFDIYYSSAVIKYSPNIKRTVAEAIRVTKNGGLMVFGFTFGSETDIVPKGSHLKGGVKEFISLFKGHVKTVCFCDEFMLSNEDIRVGVIFRLVKYDEK